MHSSSHSHDLDHARLVAGVRAGDESVFEELFYRYYPTLFRFACGFVNDRDLADDMVQEVFGAIWVRHAEWTPAANIESYLMTAVRNRALNQVRNTRSQTQARARYADAGESPGMGMSEDASAPDQFGEVVSVVWRAIEHMPEPRRTILFLRWQHGYDWDTIAGIVGMSNVAARKQHSRALDALRQFIVQHHE